MRIISFSKILIAVLLFFWGGTELGGNSSLRGADVSNPEARPSFCLRTEWFDRGNAVRGGAPWCDRYICLCTGGEPTTWVEFDVDFPQAGSYRLDGLYSANDSRPLLLSLDGKPVGPTFAEKTGSWQTADAQWAKQALLTVEQPGKHTLRFQTEKTHIPHICALKLTPEFEMSKPWTLPRAKAKEQVLLNDDKQWRPGPWSGGWYAPYALDRHQKREAGEWFQRHFARESALALVPRERLDFELVPKISPAERVASVRLDDELTYLPEYFLPPKNNAEKEKDAEAGPVGPHGENIGDHFSDEARTFAVDVAVKPSENPEDLALPKTVRIEVSPERWTEMLVRIRGLVAAFREMEGDDSLLSSALEKCGALERRGADWTQTVSADDLSAEKKREAVELTLDTVRLYSETARSNPLLDFDKILFIRRKATHLGLPQNYESNSALPVNAFDDRLMTLQLSDDGKISDTPKISTLFAPDYKTFLGDLDLHFDAEKILASSLDRERRWNVFEIDLNKAAAGAKTDEVMTKQLPDFEDAANYDACYLPDESLLFTSSSCYISVPCMSGNTRVTNMFRKNADGTIRRLTFDQEHNWCPTLLPDGRVLYLRWEYTDIPHVSGRVLFQMNPDGTGQLGVYGSNSLWPVSMLYAKPIPGSTTQFAAVVTGHHGVPRMGELVLFDVQKGRKDESGAVERICGSPKKVESRTDTKYYSTLTGDNITDESWPKYLQPQPLSEDYYLVTAQPAPGDLWGIYLADRADNLVLLAELDQYACMEPIPWRASERPPVMTDRVDLSKKNANVYIADLYYGDGLKNVPRGTIKNLRLYSYNYVFTGLGGWNGIVGVDGPWDVRQIVGTVPVNPDGSALFEVPANVPLAIQPLDENGTAVQQMRSWFTAMPGEFVSCTGCHEDKNSTSAASRTAFVSDGEVSTIRPWYGPMRGFSFEREVQPVLDHYCVACHDGADHGWGGVVPFDLRGGNIVKDYATAFYYNRLNLGRFSTSYVNLARFVRRPGLENDNDLLTPMEFNAATTELFQILRDDHYGLQLDAESWDRLITWIDMNAPYHGTWNEYAGKENAEKWDRLRREILEEYAQFQDSSEAARGEPFDPKKAGSLLRTDHSVIPVSTKRSDYLDGVLRQVANGERAFPDGGELKKRLDADSSQIALQEKGKRLLPGAESPTREEWSRRPAKTDRKMDREQADSVAMMPSELRSEESLQTVMLDEKTPLYLSRLPAPENSSDKTSNALWMGTFEITNRQFEIFDPKHDSRVESRHGLSHGIRGFYVNAPERPVCRVSWNEANAFCDWLSKKTGKKFRLPSAEEWETAARAGTKTLFWYGDGETDFSPYANLADQMLVEFTCDMYLHQRVPLNATWIDDWIPKDVRFCDDGFLSERPGLYLPNPWGLFDMQGNVAEWTSTEVSNRTGIDVLDQESPRKMVCGGSWYDRPYRAAPGFRTSFYPWQSVFDVGFRVVCESADNR